MGQVGQEDGRNCKNKKVKESEETDMKKRVMITVIILAMAIVGAGCGAKSNSSETAQAETTVKEEKKEVTKSNKQDINTDEINNSNMESEDTMQEEDSTETSDMSIAKQENTSKNVSTKEENKTTAVENNSGKSNNTQSSKNKTDNTTTAKNNSESGKNNDSQQNTSTTTTTNNSQATHTHTWQHIEATGHYETVVVQSAWDEEVPVYEDVERDICNVCGKDITALGVTGISAHSEAHALAYEGSGWHSEVRTEQTGIKIVHHEPVTEQHWIQDSPAYDRCTTCGETK